MIKMLFKRGSGVNMNYSLKHRHLHSGTSWQQSHIPDPHSSESLASITGWGCLMTSVDDMMPSEGGTRMWSSGYTCSVLSWMWDRNTQSANWWRSCHNTEDLKSFGQTDMRVSEAQAAHSNFTLFIVYCVWGAAERVKSHNYKSV